MPLEQGLREQINEYCKRDLPGDINWHINQFDFIDNIELRNKVGRAFYSARFISKLMEGLYVAGDDIHPFVKFQIIQYASIYEAVTTYLLWDKYSDHIEVKALQTHKAYKPVSALGSLTKLTYDGADLFTCVYKDTKTPKNSIPFKDRVDCGVRIGFIDTAYSEDIKKIYSLRNLTHLESEAERQVEMELEDSKKGYWRMKPFIDKIKEFLANEA
ncbi:MAG: hypothetical protein CO118_05725 [Flavobacteriales bacterium CG_4_9_14_3_um_filter_32_8]|nr:MAG: hypothetical protein CO118_05725 [Flavobacteriales bacterium CG_4_9_14_3_um_filter_32_8]